MARTLAYEVLLRVETDDAFSHIALGQALDASNLDARDRGLATALVYGTLTWQRAIDNLLNRHLRRGGTRNLDPQVRTILRLGAFQIRFLDRIPSHAAVDSAVELTKEVGKTRAAGLVNAVLRAVSEDDDPWWRESDRDRKKARWLADKWSLPTWLANRLQQRFRDRAETIAESFTEAPPLYLRRPEGAEALDGADPVEGVPGAYVADSAAVWRDEVATGPWVVQDLGSQLIGWYAGAEAAMRILDACAGLGGKTLQLAETGAEVVALDPQGSKIELLREAVERAELSVTAHVTSLEDYDEEGHFDLVVVDAPCSGLGILRRHAETRWARREGDIGKLCRIQSNLLEHAAARVEPGGLLVYSVCTFTREETVRQVERFLAGHAEFERETPPKGPIDWSRWTTEQGDLFVMPDTHETDGFYAVRLRRRSAP